MMALAFSCSDPVNNVRPSLVENNIQISEAQQHFASVAAALPHTEMPGSPALPRHKLLKMAGWRQAYHKNLSMGSALVVPVKFEQEIYYKPSAESKTTIPISALTHLLFYKDKQKAMHMEVVTSLPGLDKSDNVPGQKFKGRVIVEDWRGEYITGFKFERGKMNKITLSKRVPTQGALAICTSTIWGTCYSDRDGTSYGCTYDYTEVTCDVMDGGEGGGVTPVDNSGGGGGGSDYADVASYLWDDQINDSNLKPCMQKILADLKNLTNGKVSQIIQKFSGTTPGYNWEMKDGSLPASVNASTSTNFNAATGTVTTTFDASKFTSSTDLSVARTILHESIHAYVIAVTYNTLTDTVKRKQLLGPDWLTVAMNYGHDYMTNNYLTPLANALQEYGNNVLGYALPLQFYHDMAWGGLANYQTPPNNETALFQQIVPSAADRLRIKNVVNTALTGKDFYGNTQVQKGKKAGC